MLICSLCEMHGVQSKIIIKYFPFFTLDRFLDSISFSNLVLCVIAQIVHVSCSLSFFDKPSQVFIICRISEEVIPKSLLQKQNTLLQFKEYTSHVRSKISPCCYNNSVKIVFFLNCLENQFEN